MRTWVRIVQVTLIKEEATYQFVAIVEEVVVWQCIYAVGWRFWVQVLCLFCTEGACKCSVSLHCSVALYAIHRFGCPRVSVDLAQIVFVFTIHFKRYVRNLDMVIWNHQLVRLCFSACLGEQRFISRCFILRNILCREEDVWRVSIQHHIVSGHAIHVDWCKLYLIAGKRCQFSQFCVSAESLTKLVAGEFNGQHNRVPFIACKTLFKV